MAKKIILYMTDRAEGTEEKYRCPEGKSLKGIRTNEAPVKYLLRKYPDITQIICMLSPEARKSAWNPVQKYIKKDYPNVEFVPVDIKTEEDFSKTPLKKIMSLVGPEDEILLETSGGFRNTVMDMLLLSQVLSYGGIKTIGAVYSNYKKKQIEDISYLFQRFDLVKGMHELMDFGRISALREYYGNQIEDPVIEEMIASMEKLTDEILMCHTGKIDSAMERVNRALESADKCSDPLMTALLPAFRKKFQGRLTLPSLILWCLDSNMIQQALTIYKERMPEYVLNPENGIAERKANSQRRELKFKGADTKEADFIASLEEMKDRADLTFPKHFIGHFPKNYCRDKTVYMLDQFSELLKDSDFILHCKPEQFRKIVIDYFYVRDIRNMVNHANDALESHNEFYIYLKDFHNIDYSGEINVKKIKAILRKSAKDMNLKMNH